MALFYFYQRRGFPAAVIVGVWAAGVEAAALWHASGVGHGARDDVEPRLVAVEVGNRAHQALSVKMVGIVE